MINSFFWINRRKVMFFWCNFLSYFHSGVSGMVVDIRHGAAALIVLLGSLPPVTIQLGFSLPAFHISSFDCRKTVSLCASRLINCQPECLFSFVQPRDLGWAIGRKNCTVCKIVVITLYYSAGLVLLQKVERKYQSFGI